MNDSTSNTNNADGATPFRSEPEVHAAMRDPRYTKDEAYRRDVEERIAAAPKGKIYHDPRVPADPVEEGWRREAEAIEAGPAQPASVQAPAEGLPGVDMSNPTVQDMLVNTGGTAGYVAFLAWAQTNLSPAEEARYNDAVDAEDLTTIRAFTSRWPGNPTGTMERAFRQRMVATLGIHVNPPAAEGFAAASEGFKTREEMTAAVRDPRYRRDEGYRREVESKIAATDL